MQVGGIFKERVADATGKSEGASLDGEPWTRV